jgi:hypothetical protein
MLAPQPTKKYDIMAMIWKRREREREREREGLSFPPTCLPRIIFYKK